ncbi:MAG: nicotinamide mononucleotide transporter [Arcobacteraceae bacterium]|jgi:hypothetical protein|nr:nicotinamide mononucleotide transporter [Arcobacteraceae bacterium]
MILLEAFGAIFSILGAYLMATSTKINTKPLYYGFISFFISNTALLIFFTLKGKVPIILQMVLFFMTAIIGIYKHTSHKKRDTMLMSMVLLLLGCVLYFSIVPRMREIDFTVLWVDLLASSLAIFGSFLLSSHTPKIRGYAFICFFIADVVFVYIGLTNAFYFFMVQSLFYLYTSVKGYKNTL